MVMETILRIKNRSSYTWLSLRNEAWKQSSELKIGSVKHDYHWEMKLREWRLFILSFIAIYVPFWVFINTSMHIYANFIALSLTNNKLCIFSTYNLISLDRYYTYETVTTIKMINIYITTCLLKKKVRFKLLSLNSLS